MVTLTIDRVAGAWQVEREGKVIARCASGTALETFLREHNYRMSHTKIVWCEPWNDPKQRECFRDG